MTKSNDMFACGDHDRAVYMGCLTCDKRGKAERDRLAERIAEVERERDAGNASLRIAMEEFEKVRDALKTEVAELKRQLATAEAHVWREAAALIEQWRAGVMPVRYLIEEFRKRTVATKSKE